MPNPTLTTAIASFALLLGCSGDVSVPPPAPTLIPTAGLCPLPSSLCAQGGTCQDITTVAAQHQRFCYPLARGSCNAAICCAAGTRCYPTFPIPGSVLGPRMGYCLTVEEAARACEPGQRDSIFICENGTASQSVMCLVGP